MVKKALFLVTFYLRFSLYSLNTQPWYDDIWEFTFAPSYTYDYFSRVQNGRPQLETGLNNHLLVFDLAFSPSPLWEVDGGIEFADTSSQKTSFRSGALQIRYLWLDDVTGDPVSLTTGVNFRAVSPRSLKDLNTPYHAEFDFEFNASLGREWSRRTLWYLRAYAFASGGIGNRGFPWLCFLGKIEGNIKKAHRLGTFAEGYFGFGDKNTVNTKHFNGYGLIRHRSIDLGGEYTYIFPVSGRLSFSYTHRLYAHAFPQAVKFFTIKYLFPFSLF